MSFLIKTTSTAIFIFLNLCSEFVFSYPIRNHHVYITNQTNFPVIIKYVKCLDSKEADAQRKLSCSTNEITIEVPETSSVNIGDYVIRQTYLIDGEFFMITAISNNVVTKYYSNDLYNIAEVHCGGDVTSSLILIDDYKSNDQIFCKSVRFSGIKL